MLPDCVFILSAKSSGSSALQRELKNRFGYSTALSPGHYENETLFWSKAASILGLQQQSLPESEVPIRPQRARREVVEFLSLNGISIPEEPFTEKQLFSAWSDLIKANRNRLIEKSPHHLYQEEVVKLMEKYVKFHGNIVFLGIIRNPLDTLYSSWRRFGISPAEEERFWVNAYTNLQNLKSRCPEIVQIFKYEDLVNQQKNHVQFSFEDDQHKNISSDFNAKSIGKWKSDPDFVHKLSPDTISLANEFGYSIDSLHNQNAGRITMRYYFRQLIKRYYGRVPNKYKNQIIKPFLSKIIKK